MIVVRAIRKRKKSNKKEHFFFFQRGGGGQVFPPIVIGLTDRIIAKLTDTRLLLGLEGVGAHLGKI